ncbi:MAG TPA: hypothetical protein VGT02_12915 [Methylomirabilota bacterium]|jgi:class 3 adenylate cyclase|nr:hypothetical protein [Methylomirabilota bacterium]
MIFVIADLAGYTALTEAHGGEGAAAAVARYRELAEGALATGARIVEQVGDELLIVADDARAAVTTAARLRAAVDDEPRFPGVRIGIHGGPVVERNGRYFGAALNVAARLAARARADEILCSAEVAGACRDLAGVTFHALGPQRLKNVPAPVEVVALERADIHRTSPMDPVCRMHLEPEAAAVRVAIGDATHVFCSLDCARAFLAHPERYRT